VSNYLQHLFKTMKRIKPTKPEMVRFRATPAQKAEFKRRGGAEAAREWLDNEPYDADMLTVAYLDGLYTGKKLAKKDVK